MGSCRYQSYLAKVQFVVFSCVLNILVVTPPPVYPSVAHMWLKIINTELYKCFYKVFHNVPVCFINFLTWQTTHLLISYAVTDVDKLWKELVSRPEHNPNTHPNTHTHQLSLGRARHSLWAAVLVWVIYLFIYSFGSKRRTPNGRLGC